MQNQLTEKIINDINKLLINEKQIVVNIDKIFFENDNEKINILLKNLINVNNMSPILKGYWKETLEDFIKNKKAS